ncbi:MAG: inositol monophosphatase [Methanomassiliicoccales archaeon]|nr:MAG: inositol monophosphatase [Methanomassiliicoccales archaeon]
MMRHLIGIADMVQQAVRTIPNDIEPGEELYMGADGTPTLVIDRLAEDAIIDYVVKNELHWNILSEEAGLIDNGGDMTLVIDPIDGTYNAVLGIPLYSVSLALGKSSMEDIQEGYVRNLVTGDSYSATKGQGAFLNGKRIRTRKADKGKIFSLAYMGRFATPECYNVALKSARTRSLGCSSLELSLVAQGKADAFYLNTSRYEKAIRVVDIAAAALVLREAGGDVCDLEGNRLDMPFDLKVRSNFLAYGDECVKEVLL